MNDYIKIKKRDTVKIGIKDENDNVVLDDNGKEVYIEFDLEDINLPNNYSKCCYLIKKSTTELNNKLTIISKKEDSKYNEVMTKNQKETADALEKYYVQIEEAMDLFLGKGGVQKIFGKKRYLDMFDDLVEMLEPIMPLIKVNHESIKEKIRTKYKIEEDNVLRNE